MSVRLFSRNAQVVVEDRFAQDLDAVLQGLLVVGILLVALGDDDVVGLLVDLALVHVAVLPDQGGWLSSDTKVYQTVVTIDEDVEQLKPGMTAVVDIHVAQLDDVRAAGQRLAHDRLRIEAAQLRRHDQVEARVEEHPGTIIRA